MLSGTVAAQEKVTLIYPWGMGDPMANYSRTLVAEANQMQNQWLFILDGKPGAGGSIGAKHVATTPNTVLASTTAFFVRPNLLPRESHNISDFRVLMTQCAINWVITSHKYKNWDEVPKNQPLNIGVSGIGATTHLIAMQIKQRYPLLEPVPYKSTNASTLDLASQRIDLNVGFLGEAEQWIDQGKLFALGISGPVPVKGIPTLRSQGFKELDVMTNGHSLLVSKSVPEEHFQSWRKILFEAAKKPSVQKSYSVDYCQPLTMDLKHTETWFNQQVEFWRKQSQTVKIDSK